jgi:hypothetical protein
MDGSFMRREGNQEAGSGSITDPCIFVLLISVFATLMCIMQIHYSKQVDMIIGMGLSHFPVLFRFYNLPSGTNTVLSDLAVKLVWQTTNYPI